ncbi:MAG: transcription termination factor Rho [Gemmataceae bacterium]|nr:transcription termination factor Rho [Gemmataceae bacterium]
MFQRRTAPRKPYRNKSGAVASPPRPNDGPPPAQRGNNNNNNNYQNGPPPQHRQQQQHRHNNHQQHPNQPPKQIDPERLVPAEGVLEIYPKGYGFLRDPSRHYTTGPNDAYVAPYIIERHGLLEGMAIRGLADPIRPDSGPRLMQVDTIEGEAVAGLHRRNFDELTAIDPGVPIRLETGEQPLTTRVMDLLTPIGMGQRGLIVAPPRTGKTILLQHIAAAVAQNHPEMHLIVLLIDERPEEVTEMRRTVKGEVIASCNDNDSGVHLRMAELAVSRAKRLVEQGRHVFVLLDSLTRLARAYNKAANTGRTMSGGLDSKALDIPKRLFGSARCFEEGGSLTVMGTCLIETGSKMDDIIFQEFKGTGNMELVLDRKLADRRIFPAIDIAASGTRKEERLMPAEVLTKVHMLRRMLLQMNPVEAMEAMVKQLSKSPSNAAFLERMAAATR